MKEGNNGGYANNWLIGRPQDQRDREPGTRAEERHAASAPRTATSSAPTSRSIRKLLKEETEFDSKDTRLSENARRERWLQLMEQNKGKIDAAAGQRFLADHFDTFAEQGGAERAHAVRAHRPLAARYRAWQPPYGLAGAVQNKVDGRRAAPRR